MITVEEMDEIQVLDMDQAMVEALCMHNGFVKLGYDPDQISFVVSENELDVALKNAGPDDFTVRLAKIDPPIPKGHLIPLWERKIDWWNSLDQTARQAIWHSSFAVKYAYQIVACMVSKGFKLPTQKSAVKTPAWTN